MKPRPSSLLRSPEKSNSDRSRRRHRSTVLGGLIFLGSSMIVPTWLLGLSNSESLSVISMDISMLPIDPKEPLRVLTDTFSAVAAAEPLSRVLKKESASAAALFGDQRTEGSLFLPGSLQMSRTEALAQCYVNPDIYQKHMLKYGPSTSQLLASKANNKENNPTDGNGKNTTTSTTTEDIVYFLVAKSGSSTLRGYLHDQWGSVERIYLRPLSAHRRSDPKNYSSSNVRHHFSVVRDPFQRFVSQYQETLSRILRYQRKVPAAYVKFLQRRPGQPQWTSDLYLEMLKQQQQPNDDSDTALRMLEQFIDDYDGHWPFDSHLRMQVPHFVHWGTGTPFPVERLFDLDDPDLKTNVYNYLRSHNHSPTVSSSNMDGKATAATFPHARRRVTARSDQPTENNKYSYLERVSRKSRRKVCQLAALDYCCLNFALPPECLGSDDDDDLTESAAVQCRWTRHPNRTDDDPTLYIEPVSPYPRDASGLHTKINF